MKRFTCGSLRVLAIALALIIASSTVASNLSTAKPIERPYQEDQIENAWPWKILVVDIYDTYTDRLIKINTTALGFLRYYYQYVNEDSDFNEFKKWEEDFLNASPDKRQIDLKEFLVATKDLRKPQQRDFFIRQRIDEELTSVLSDDEYKSTSRSCEILNKYFKPDPYWRGTAVSSSIVNTTNSEVLLEKLAYDNIIVSKGICTTGARVVLNNASCACGMCPAKEDMTISETSIPTQISIDTALGIIGNDTPCPGPDRDMGWPIATTPNYVVTVQDTWTEKTLALLLHDYDVRELYEMGYAKDPSPPTFKVWKTKTSSGPVIMNLRAYAMRDEGIRFHGDAWYKERFLQKEATDLNAAIYKNLGDMCEILASYTGPGPVKRALSVNTPPQPELHQAVVTRLAQEGLEISFSDSFAMISLDEKTCVWAVSGGRNERFALNITSGS